MKKIIKKWYFSIFIIPIVLTYLTSYFDLPWLIKNWIISAGISIAILFLTFVYEIFSLNRELSQKAPKYIDIIIMTKLIRLLDIKSFEEHFVKGDSWYGYPKYSIRTLSEFSTESKILVNKTSDNELNKIIAKLNESIDSLLELTGRHMFLSNDGYMFDTEIDKNRKNAEVIAPQINKKVDLIFKQMNTLRGYLLKRNYFG